ncbi:hypothetical protein DVR09_00700 [Erythrobacter aureus]|uniref:Uncharacterized protein n=1 Tax=Erythrobacter aureus TaxID=2182384 RepID=A0A345YAU0_9SPHN|nr:hypothetical protein DVR09_00700 [Erythrobacter aureus]
MIAHEIVEMIPGKDAQGVCDDCITAALGLSRRQQAQRVTSALAVTPSYHRWQDECYMCGKTKLVIAHA